jgi:hypothetical protein
MNLIVEIMFAIDDPDCNSQKTMFHWALIRNRSITDLLIFIVSEINKFIDTLSLNVFPSPINYNWTDFYHSRNHPQY